MSRKKRCLVLGANGFIGSHLVDELIDAGYLVRAFDRFNRDQQFANHDRLEVLKGDAYDKSSMEAALHEVDYFFHCFSATTPFTSDNDPFLDIDRNLRPSVGFFDQCVKRDISKVIYMSSGGAIYGPVAEKTAPKEDDPALPISPYGINKLAIENYLAYFHKRYGLKYVTYRLANPYGTRQANNLQGVIPIFLKKIMAGEELVVYGDGGSSRDYLYVRDATNMIAKSFAKSTKFNTYNIGSGHQLTINKIISTIEKVTGKKAIVRYEKAPKTFLKKSQISTERFSNEFHIETTTSLEDGIKLTLEDILS